MTDEELDALATRAMVIDHLLEVDFDTQRDVERNTYGAREAIETALYLIRDQTTAITTLRAQLAEAQKERDAVVAALVETGRWWDKEKARADRAEAALAAQIEVDAGIAFTAATSSAPATQRKRIATAIRNQPHDRTALDRHDAKTREKALREAAEILDDEGWLGMSKHRILAMIPKGESHE